MQIMQIKNHSGCKIIFNSSCQSPDMGQWVSQTHLCQKGMQL